MGSRYDNLDEYMLRSITVHMPSEHTFLGRRMPVEVQLWHDPIIHHDLRDLQEKRQKAQKMLNEFHAKVKLWGEEVRSFQHGAFTDPFPNLKTEEDWSDTAREHINSHGEKITEEARLLRAQMQEIDDGSVALITKLKRDGAARSVVLSLLFRRSDVTTPHQLEASKFFQWLAAAANQPRPHENMQNRVARKLMILMRTPACRKVVPQHPMPRRFSRPMSFQSCPTRAGRTPGAASSTRCSRTRAASQGPRVRP